MLKNIYDLEKIEGANYREISEEAVAALVTSIKEVGLQEPIQLFEVAESGKLYVVSGHHRLEAMKRVSRDPQYSHRVFQAYVTTGTAEELASQKVAIRAVVANVLRKDLSLVERAQAYHKLRETGISAASISRMVHKDKRTIEMTLNVALLPPQALAFIQEQERLKDSVVYKLAVKYKKDPQFDILAALKESLAQRRKGAVAKDVVRFNRSAAHDRLVAEGGFSNEVAARIIAILADSTGTSHQQTVP